MWRRLRPLERARAPTQSQEAETRRSYTRKNGVPYCHLIFSVRVGAQTAKTPIWDNTRMHARLPSRPSIVKHNFACSCVQRLGVPHFEWRIQTLRVGIVLDRVPRRFHVQWRDSLGREPRRNFEPLENADC